MADAHNKKAGNKGDVWKHFILASVADALMSADSGINHFTYVDTHCSLGYFPLNPAGEWKSGIGRLYAKDWRLADHPYFVIEKGAGTGKAYLGSWRLVKEIALSRGITCDLRLFDTSPLVATELKDQPGFSHSSGFDAVGSVASPDLILCDPAYSDNRDKDWKSIGDFASACNLRDRSALIWYPVFVKEPPLDRFGGCVVAEVRWPCSGANQVMRGCGMIALGSARQVVASMASELAELAAALGGSITRPAAQS